MYSAEVFARVADVTSSVTAELDEGRNRKKLFELAVVTNRHCFAIFVPVAIFLWVFGSQLLRVWVSPQVSEKSGPLLPVLLICFLFAIAGQYNSGAVLIGQGKHGPYAYGIVVEVILSTACLFAIVPRYGALGAAWVVSMAIVSGRGVYLAILMCRLNGFPLREYITAIYARPLLTGLPVLMTAIGLRSFVWPGRSWLELILDVGPSAHCISLSHFSRYSTRKIGRSFWAGCGWNVCYINSSLGCILRMPLHTPRAREVISLLENVDDPLGAASAIAAKEADPSSRQEIIEGAVAHFGERLNARSLQALVRYARNVGQENLTEAAAVRLLAIPTKAGQWLAAITLEVLGRHERAASVLEEMQDVSWREERAIRLIALARNLIQAGRIEEAWAPLRQAASSAETRQTAVAVGRLVTQTVRTAQPPARAFRRVAVIGTGTLQFWADVLKPELFGVGIWSEMFVGKLRAIPTGDLGFKIATGGFSA